MIARKKINLEVTDIVTEDTEVEALLKTESEMGTIEEDDIDHAPTHHDPATATAHPENAHAPPTVLEKNPPHPPRNNQKTTTPTPSTP